MLRVESGVLVWVLVKKGLVMVWVKKVWVLVMVWVKMVLVKKKRKPHYDSEASV